MSPLKRGSTAGKISVPTISLSAARSESSISEVPDPSQRTEWSTALAIKTACTSQKAPKAVIFSSDSEETPAKFYMVSAPAHTSYETKLITLKVAAKRPLGDANTSNKRVINQFIHPDVLKTCQLSMGMTALEPGSVWNSMPCHTHERRMEIYMYFEVPENQVVMHFMGEPTETRHIVMKNEEAVTARPGAPLRSREPPTTPLSGLWAERIRSSTIWTTSLRWI